MLWCHWVVSKSCLEVSIWTFLQSLSWCFEPGCEKRELSDTECSCGNDMPIKKQVYPEVYPFWLKYVPNIRLSMEKSTLNCVILTGLGYIWWFGLRPWGSGRLSLNESHGPPLQWTPPACRRDSKEEALAVNYPVTESCFGYMGHQLSGGKRASGWYWETLAHIIT